MIINGDTGAVVGAYYADGTAVRDNAVFEVQNPITRSVCRLDPPLPMADYDAFMDAFHRFCDDAWTATPRRDPQLVNPHRVMDGTEIVDVLAATMERMAHEYGPYTAQSAVLEASDQYWTSHGIPAPGAFGPLPPVMPVPVDEAP